MVCGSFLPFLSLRERKDNCRNGRFHALGISRTGKPQRCIEHKSPTGTKTNTPVCSAIIFMQQMEDIHAHKTDLFHTDSTDRDGQSASPSLGMSFSPQMNAKGRKSMRMRRDRTFPNRFKLPSGELFFLTSSLRHPIKIR